MSPRYFNWRRFKKWLRKLDRWNKRDWWECSSRLKNYIGREPPAPLDLPPWRRTKV